MIIEELITEMLGRPTEQPDRGACPVWPPDVMAVAGAVLQASEAYVQAVTQCGDAPPCLEASWVEDVSAHGEAWRVEVDAGRQPPKTVLQFWSKLWGARHAAVADVSAQPGLSRALLALLGAADIACAGVGIPSAGQRTSFIEKLEAQLGSAHGRTLCREVQLERAWVLPKQHTPQRGLTLRSFSHHLALGMGSGLDVRFNVSPPGSLRALDRLNVLLLPWPIAVRPTQFSAHENNGRARPEGRFGFFGYEPDSLGADGLIERIEHAIEEGRRQAGGIDLVVLPELALAELDVEPVREAVAALGCALVAGCHGTVEGEKVNQVVIDHAGLAATEEGRRSLLMAGATLQSKHHRWCLDRGQIVQYGLAAQLHPDKNWWEATRISRKELSFFSLASWLTCCCLVCEDLARQDPAAPVIRLIGPNLVIALLMDGPQLAHRWGARYASVLTEDPGCSVLALTSIGMCELSRPAAGNGPISRVVARWRDVRTGEQEIHMPKNHDAAVLTLIQHAKQEFTADGRGDGSAAYFPIYAGHRTFATTHNL